MFNFPIRLTKTLSLNFEIEVDETVLKVLKISKKLLGTLSKLNVMPLIRRVSIFLSSQHLIAPALKTYKSCLKLIFFF